MSARTTYIHCQEGTERIGMPGKDTRTRLPREDSQEKTARTRLLAVHDSQDRTARAGERTARTGQLGQGFLDRAAMIGQA
jgi:hypothetical protein